MTYVLDGGPLRAHFNFEGRAKKSHATQAEALDHAAVLQRSPRASNRRPYHAYRCEICGSWHVGRRESRERRKNRLAAS